jgi:murein DD-endopeptidase MepM/ murein hydrolase activator NlpD/uncharacterized protein YukE
LYFYGKYIIIVLEDNLFFHKYYSCRDNVGKGGKGMAIKADVQLSVAAKEASKKKFKAEKDRIIGSLERLQREVNNTRGWWRGESGAAFAEKFTRTKEKITVGIEGSMADYCALMDATVEALMDTDRQLAAKVISDTTSNWPSGMPPASTRIDTLHVRSALESQGNKVEWQAGAQSGESTVTVTAKNGDVKTLKEGEDFYIGKDGKAYYYNNVRDIFEANGAKVDFTKTPDGGSTITVSMPTQVSGFMQYLPIATLVQGTDYFIGADGKAHFLDMTYGLLPPVAKAQSGATSSGTQENFKAPSNSNQSVSDYYGFDISDWSYPLPTRPSSANDPMTGNRWFGAKRDNGVRAHAGMDLVVSAGTSVSAMSDGMIVGYTADFYKGTSSIAVLHDNGLIVNYCEVSVESEFVKRYKEEQAKEADDRLPIYVFQGQQLGEVKKSATGSMLHIEVYAGTQGRDFGVVLYENNKDSYDYVDSINYRRRADLLDPTIIKDLIITDE